MPIRVRTDGLALGKEQSPVKHIVKNVDVCFSGCVSHHVFQSSEVGCFLESQLSYIVHVVLELDGQVLTQLLIGALRLSLANSSITRRRLCHGDALPGQASLYQVDNDITKCDEVISTRLLIAHVCVDRDIAACANEILARIEGDVVVCFGVYDEASQSEVDHVHDVASFAQSHHDVVRLYVTVDVILPVQVLDSL